MILITGLLMFLVVIIGIIASLAGVQTDAGFTTLFVILLVVVVFIMLAGMGAFNKRDK